MTEETPELDIAIRNRSRIRLYKSRTEISGIDTPADLINVMRAVMTLAKVFDKMEERVLGKTIDKLGN